MKKIILTLSVVAMLVCIFAISASAGTFGQADTSAGIPVGTVITDTESQIQMSDGKIYPAYYFFNDSTTAKFNFDKVKKADGSSYTKADVVKVEIPEGVVNFEDYNFTQGKCTLLEYVSLPSTLQTITRQAFNGTPKLTTITIPDSVTTIGPAAFRGCKALKEVVINPTSSLTKIEGSAFQNTSVESFYFPNSLTTLGSAVFAYNENGSLKELVNFENCGVTSIPSELFRQCTGLKTIKFPKGTTQINGSNLFSNCNIETIYLPKTLQTISNPITAKSINKVVFAAAKGTSLPANAPSTATLEYANYCDVYYGSKHSENAVETYDFTSFTEKSYLRSVCSRCQSGTVLKEVEPLFVVLGFSAAQYGDAIYSVNYRVNDEAIEAYMEITGETVNYGVFAVKAETIGKNDIFDENGDERQGVIAADLTDAGFGLVNLKIMGFNEEQKKTPLAMGAYVKTEKDGAVKYSYVQIAPASAGEKYYLASYNDVVALLDEGNAQ